MFGPCLMSGSCFEESFWKIKFVRWLLFVRAFPCWASLAPFSVSSPVAARQKPDR
jgi:hypothetical protein